MIVLGARLDKSRHCLEKDASATVLGIVTGLAIKRVSAKIEPYSSSKLELALKVSYALL